jgi:hypothetical protein
VAPGESPNPYAAPSNPPVGASSSRWRQAIGGCAVQALGLGLGVLAGLARHFAEEGPPEGRPSTAPHWTDVPGLIGAGLLLLGGLPAMITWWSRSRTGRGPT